MLTITGLFSIYAAIALNFSVDSPIKLPRRGTPIAITKKGEELYDKYDKNYYSRLLNYLDDISDADADCMIQTIEKFYKVMRERQVDIE